MLGHEAKRDEEKENHGFSVKRKERWNPIVIRGKFLSSNKIVLNVLFMLDNYPLKKKKKKKHTQIIIPNT